jgi:hypothetical protein
MVGLLAVLRLLALPEATELRRVELLAVEFTELAEPTLDAFERLEGLDQEAEVAAERVEPLELGEQLA